MIGIHEWKVDAPILTALHDWIFANESGYKLLETTLEPKEIPGFEHLLRGLQRVSSGPVVVTNAGFYVGVEGMEEHSHWHVDAELWYFGGTFGNVLIPLVQERDTGMEFFSGEWDPCWTLLESKEDSDDCVRFKVATQTGSVSEIVSARGHVLETRVGNAYCFSTCRPHKSLPRGRRFGLFFGFIRVDRLRNPHIRPWDRRGYIDSIIACFQGKEEEDSAVVAERYRNFWRLLDKPLGDNNPWRRAWLQLRSHHNNPFLNRGV